ncbi:E3 SUMO-protein ligase NSE2-like [Leptopilina heterotoma]|uniref:E3 SUMO-protein ligase NSE2-like n=1 Tax=Leptopilina heterotoma TaxID=63436 RepID=UPI001CA978EC|nr:E3 SUMO-protein ligase NSE2-like [Leptopilina heterotoma]
MTSFENLAEQIQESFSKTAAHIFLYHEKDRQAELFEEMKNVVEKHCVINAKLQEANRVIERIAALQSSEGEGSQFEDILEKYKNEMDKINPDVSRNRNLVDFNRQIKDLLKDGENDKSKDNNDDDDDDDLQCTQKEINVVDPFTKKRMTDPMRNKLCGHIYDRESVTALLKVNPRTRCPVVGCGSKEFVTLQNLEADIVLRTRLLKMKA